MSEQLRYFSICEPCVRGEGAECHTPECALFLRDVPSCGLVEAFALTPAEHVCGLAADILAISRMLDETYPPDLNREAWRWRRCGKISEENGEVTEALLGLSGENPRKGVTHTVADLRKELLDVAVTALGALAHVDGNQGDPIEALGSHASFVRARLAAVLTERTDRG